MPKNKASASARGTRIERTVRTGLAAGNIASIPGNSFHIFH
jgi:hypothetical protein